MDMSIKCKESRKILASEREYCFTICFLARSLFENFFGLSLPLHVSSKSQGGRIIEASF